jgi:phage-related protein
VSVTGRTGATGGASADHDGLLATSVGRARVNARYLDVLFFIDGLKARCAAEL